MPSPFEVDESEMLALLVHASAQVIATMRRRDELIRVAKKARVPVSRIVEATGLSRARVYQILREGT